MHLKKERKIINKIADEACELGFINNFFKVKGGIKCIENDTIYQENEIAVIEQLPTIQFNQHKKTCSYAISSDGTMGILHPTK